MLAESEIFVRAKDAGALSFQSILNTLLGLVFFMFFARVVSKADMGVYGGVMLVWNALSILGGLGLVFAASHFIPYFYGRSQYGGVLKTSKYILLVSLTSSTALCVVLGVYAENFSILLFGSVKYAYLFLVTGFLSFTTVLGNVFDGFLRGLQRFGSLALYRFLAQLSRVTVSIGLLLLGLGVLAIFLGWIVFYVAFTVLASILTFKLLHRRIIKLSGNSSPEEDPFSFKTLFGFSLPMMVYGFVTYLSDSVDRFVVLGFLGTESLGVYTVVLTAVSSLTLAFASPLLATMIPGMSESYGRFGAGNLSSMFKLSTRYASLIFIPACFGLAVLSPLAVRVVAGLKYIGEASTPLSIISLGLILYIFSILLISTLTALGKTLKVALAVLLASLAELGFSLLLTPRFGVVGASLSRILMYACMLSLLTVLASKTVQILFDKDALKKSLTASTIMFFALFSFSSYTGYNLILLPIYIILGGTVYLIMLGLLKTLTIADLKLLAKLLPITIKTVNKLNKTLRRFLLYCC